MRKLHPLRYCASDSVCRFWIEKECGRKDREMKRKDIILIIVLLLLAGLLALLYGREKRSGGRILVTVDQEEYGRYDLGKDQEIEIWTDRGTNVLVIEEGQAYIRDADCPDRYCVRQGHISRTGESLICLPHRVVVEVEEGDGQDSSVDALTR